MKVGAQEQETRMKVRRREEGGQRRREA